MFISVDAIITFSILGIFFLMLINTVIFFLINNSLKKIIKKEGKNIK